MTQPKRQKLLTPGHDMSAAVGLLAIISFAVFFSFVSPALWQSSAQAEITITLTVTTSDSGCIVPYEDYQIRFGDRTLTTKGTDYTRDLQISPGRNLLSVTMPGKPGVTIDRVVVGTSEENKQTYAADNGSVIVDFDIWRGEHPTVFVYLAGLCNAGTDDEATEKDLKVLIYSTNCDNPDWSDLKVRIGDLEIDAVGAEEMPSFGSAPGGRRAKVKLNPGQKQISIESPTFPVSSIENVYVVKEYVVKDLSKNAGELLSIVGEFRPGDTGEVSVNLMPALWEKSKRFEALSLTIRLKGNCADAKDDALSFGLLTVKAISGDVEVQYRFLKPPFNRAYPGVGSTLRRGAVIKTGKDGLIVLESEYMHTVTIDSSTQVRFDELMSTTGRRQLTAFIEKGKIKIDRKGRDLKDTPTTAVQTDTATVGSVKTVYDVSYDQSSKLTTVSVDEGEVEVFPTNDTIESARLTAGEQAQVSSTKMVRGAGTGLFGRIGATPLLLYAGIGVGVLIVMIIIILLLYLIYRISKPASSQSAFRGARVPAPWRPQRQSGSRLCPNPHCRAVQPVNTNFCGVCGSTF